MMARRICFSHRPSVVSYRRNGAVYRAYRPSSRLAFASGPDHPSLLAETIPQHFAKTVARYGDRTAVVSQHQHRIVTYEQLDDDSSALARGLRELGIRRGDRCAVMLGNNIEFATLTYALFKLGAILVPLNPAFRIAQVVSALNHLNASHLVLSVETNLPFKPSRSNLPLIEQIVADRHARELRSDSVPSLRSLIVVDNTSSETWLSPFNATVGYATALDVGKSTQCTAFDNLDAHDTVNIQFTSGTTSAPKAAMLTHRSILNNGKSIGDRMRLTEQDVVCCPPPLFHCFGSVLGYMATATHGSAIVFPAESFNPSATIEAVQSYGCTALYGVPTMFLSELELLAQRTVSRKGLSQLRTGIAAGSSIPSELMRKLHRELNLSELTICYGMTETSPVSAMTTTDDPIEKRINTVGRLLPHVRAKIVSPSNRSQVLQIGQRGELAIAGYLLMQGYYGDTVKTADVLSRDKDGILWMHTGDEASIDEEGYISITGRIKDLIIRGGENIHPLEIESCLLAHDGVIGVSVVGIPDERYGEVVVAFITRRDTKLQADEFKDWVRRRLSNHLVPQYVFWCEDFPKTASGKIQKFKLRETAIIMAQEQQQPRE